MHAPHRTAEFRKLPDEVERKRACRSRRARHHRQLRHAQDQAHSRLVRYTPTSASLTYQVERFFALVTELDPRGRVLSSVSDLEATIQSYHRHKRQSEAVPQSLATCLNDLIAVQT